MSNKFLSLIADIYAQYYSDKTLVNTTGFRYFERDQLHRLMEVLGEKYEHQKAGLQKIKNEVSQQIKDDKAILKMGKLI